MIGSVPQGIAAGEMAELRDECATYVNVHGNRYPGGQIRGQLDHDH